MITHEQDRKEYTGRKPPEYLVKLLNSIGGYNLFGDPNFRLVWAPDRLTPSGGTWVDWDKGLAVKQRNDAVRRPIRRVSEVRMIRRYGPLQAWCLEKWCPASLYGSPKRWYSPAIIGGTMITVDGGLRRLPSQGSYPSRGDYEYTGFGYTDVELSEATVVTGVQQIIRGVEELPVSPYERLWKRTMVATQAANVVDQQFDSWALDVVENAQPAFGGNVMQGYGKKSTSSIETTARKLGFQA